LNRDASVVVCTYTLDRWATTTAAVRSAMAQVPPAREVILVVDHNPALYERAHRELSGVTVVESTGTRGLSGARNTGLDLATGDVVVFLDDDAEADAGWLVGLLAPYADEHVVGTGGRVIAVWDSGRPRWLPDEFDWVVGCSYRGLPTHQAEVRNPIGCSMSFRREAARAAGGFRSGIGRVGNVLTGGEETDLAIRIRRNQPDSRILYEPTATVRHHQPASRARWAYFRSRCYHEGRSKAVLARLEGTARGLSSERSYTTRVLPAGVLRNLGELVRGDWGGALRAAAIVAGLAITTIGYLGGRIFDRAPLVDTVPLARPGG
jgi:glycosyltransferase involved in cell wall biosynthesis